MREANRAVFTAETFRFFRELGRNNRKSWMEENRDRYRRHVVEPFRRLLDRLTPAVQRLDPEFEVGGRTGENFSRINRDIRFANDKSPYRPQFYLFFSRRGAPGRAGGQLYVGLSAEAATVGFRIYHESRQSSLACIGIPRAEKNWNWVGRRMRHRNRGFESYWYSSRQGRWTKHPGWPAGPEEWKRVKGWIVRRKFGPASALRPDFPAEISRIFRTLFPLYEFMTAARWRTRAEL